MNIAKDEKTTKYSAIDFLRSAEEKLEKEKRKESGGTQKAKPFLFVSFDICNFTQYKSNHPSKDWVKVIYELIDKKFDLLSVWKFNGDEMIFAGEVSSLAHICRIINAAQIYLVTLNDGLNKTLDDDDKVYAKSTVWMAMVDEDINDKTKNVEILPEKARMGINDFVGKHIDEGFRLTKWSSWQKVVVDPKIIYAILKAIRIYESFNSDKTLDIQNDEADFYKTIKDAYNEDIIYPGNKTKDVIIADLKRTLANTYHMGCASLKGVWDGYMYPIFWYHDVEPPNLNNCDIFEGISTVSSIFNGSGILMGRLLDLDREIPESDKLQRVNKLHDYLHNIFKEVHIEDEVYKLLNCLEFDYLEYSFKNKVNAYGTLLYYMVVCVEKTTGKVLIMRRGDKKIHLKGVWDFGNVDSKNLKMTNEIIKRYDDKFGVKIDILRDGERGGNIKPIGCCIVHRNGLNHTGILCCASISMNDGENEDSFLARVKEKAVVSNKL